jgi:small subunit ribosomal protein S4
VRYYKKALRLKGNTAHHLAEMLECRLDNIVYRLKFASTIFGAHQLVSHGHILVDGEKVDIRSFQVKPGMTISIKERSRNMKAIAAALDNPNRSVPDYLSLEADKFAGKVLSKPTLEQISWPVEIDLPEICDFLAHLT